MKSSAEVVAAVPSREVPCYLCGRDDPRVMFRQEPYRVVRCQGCGLVYTLPRLAPDQLAAMYQTAYWRSDQAKEFGYTDYLADRELYLATYRMRREVITRRKPAPGRVLDVGSAAGYFLAVMKEVGWECHGVELSAAMAETSRTLFGLTQVQSGSLLDANFRDGTFDVVTFWDVIEHLEDPLPHLERARALLKEDGLLVIETQNVESLFARAMGRRWQHYKMAEHLYHFAPRTVAALLDRAGFAIEENSPRRGGKKVSFDFLRERVGRIHPVLSTLASPLKLIGRASLYVNLFDEMLVVARKKR
jgi:2-polyprenyl-3-methyl-5-hydroxy-6-metoxy-1,4-benzoquinol methylase